MKAKSTVIKFLCWYVAIVVLFVLQKPLFMLYNGEAYAGASVSDYLSVMWHGLPHDLSLSGYLSVVPGLLLIASQWLKGRWIRLTHTVYTAFVSILLSVIFVVDTGLYEFWGTKLDTTPLFYFMSSPTAAAASVSAWFVVGAIVLMLAIATLYFAVLYRISRIEIIPANNVVSRWKRTGISVLLTALLFLPIRGGFSVATMNISAVYYSADSRLNHAAVNPAFSFMYAATHDSDFASQFNFFDDEMANERFSRLMFAENQSDSIPKVLTTNRPDIYFIILESFSAHLMPSLGGEEIAVRLDSIAREGLLFTNFYASSFRTDRAITALLSAYPGQPTTSIMKYVSKAESLPSIAGSLKDAGYECAYYYGGDANFTNMKAYLMSSGFDKIVADKDFPVSDRMSKWGVVDHKVFERCAAENFARSYNSGTPRFTVIQTSSSHEPFDVPYNNPRHTVPAANAFAYTDSCVGDFVGNLKKSSNWDNTLIILVPDHYGAYPKNLENEQRHHIPLVMSGGALVYKGMVDIPASQTDIAATLLAQLGINHEEFSFSKNVFDSSAKQFAAFSNKSILGWITPQDTVIYSIADDKLLTPDSESFDDVIAFYQVLYDDIDRR